jgi:hypothetical protein
MAGTQSLKRSEAEALVEQEFLEMKIIQLLLQWQLRKKMIDVLRLLLCLRKFLRIRREEYRSRFVFQMKWADL